MSKHELQEMYDMAKSSNKDLSKFDEQILKNDISKNNKLFARNRDLFANEKRLEGCSLYDPCRICDKCLNKASHLYVRCQNCTIPICTHKYIDRFRMIKRKNFKINVNEEVLIELRRLSDDK